MSLDVYLEDGEPMPKGSGIFVRLSQFRRRCYDGPDNS